MHLKHQRLSSKTSKRNKKAGIISNGIKQEKGNLLYLKSLEVPALTQTGSKYQEELLVRVEVPAVGLALALSVERLLTWQKTVLILARRGDSTVLAL